VRRRAAPLLGIILLGAAGLRLWFWTQASGAYMRSHEPEEGYYEQGVGLLSRGAFSLSPSVPAPANWRGPVFPSFLALTELASSRPSPSHPRLAQALLSVLGVAFVFWLGSRIGGPWAGLAGAALMALDAGQVLSANSLNVHAFYGLFLLVLAGASALWVEAPTARNGAWLGAAFGATLLTRSAHVFAVPAVLLLGAPRGDGVKAAAKRAALPVLVLLAALAPWTLRNAAQFRVFEPFDSASGAVNLYAASLGRVESATVDQAVAEAEREDPGIAALYARSGGRVFPRLRALAVGRIARSPGRYARSCAARWWSLFGRWWPVLAAALFAALSRRTRAGWAVFLVAASLSAYALIAAQNAYADAARPLLALLLGTALSEAARRLGVRLPEKAAPADEALARGAAAALAGVFALVLAAAVVFTVREALLFRPGARLDEAPPPRDDRARRLLRGIAVQDPLGANWMTYGIYASTAGRPEEACAAFETAARFADVRAESLRRLAECSLALGRRAAAESALTRAVAAFGSEAPAELLAARASLRWARGDARGAEADLARALARDARSACRPSGGLVDPGGMPPAYFDACVKRLPGDAGLWADRGVSLWKAGRAAEARASLRAALASDPGNVAAALSLAFTLGRDRSQALRVLNAALAASREPAGSPLRAEAEREAARLGSSVPLP